MAPLAPLMAALVAGQVTPPPRPYHGTGRPIMVSVTAAPGATASLALMDADGNLLGSIRSVAPGPCDLGSLFPEVWTIRKAAWVQCLVGDSPPHARPRPARPAAVETSGADRQRAARRGAPVKTPGVISAAE